jgi:two-component system sensor histidine kinase KdpD
VFLVANRAEIEGERILLTHRQKEEPLQPYRRLTPKEVEHRIEHIRRGKFKVYIGAAPGVGKTYAMLREGNDLLRKGIDVVIGLLETHGREETKAQIAKLTLIPKLKSMYNGVQLEEMDTVSIIARNPEVVLVDELAHTNVPGSAARKRYEDIVTLLEAGISVISTMNVQHPESLNDAVEQITGVRVRETVPDYILRLADEVELIDVAPNSLQQRMKEGKIYAMNKVDQALDNFFKTGNLIALRELALRELADDVDERLEALERKGSLRGPWRRQEVIFIGVTTSSNAERLIRRGFRIAHRLKVKWIVSYIHDRPQLDERLSQRIEVMRELIHRLGGTLEIQYVQRSKDMASVFIATANRYSSTQIVMGQSKRSLWKRLLHGSVVSEVLRGARHMDMLVVADYDPHLQRMKE